MQLFTEKELDDLKKNVKISRIFTYSVLALFLIVLAILFVFLNRTNEIFINVMLFISSLIFGAAFIVGAFRISFYKSILNFFKTILSYEEENIETEILFIDAKLHSLDGFKKVYQLQINKDDSLMVIYLFSAYENNFIVGKKYKIYLKGNYIVGYEEAIG